MGVEADPSLARRCRQAFAQLAHTDACKAQSSDLLAHWLRYFSDVCSVFRDVHIPDQIHAREAERAWNETAHHVACEST